MSPRGCACVLLLEKVEMEDGCPDPLRYQWSRPFGGVVVLVSLSSAAGTGCRPAPDSTLKTASRSAGSLPRFLDLGAEACISCKKMVPVLDELANEYQGRLEVQFINVFECPKVAADYGVQAIPAQIFFGPSGKELYRHEGFFAKEDILKKWKELGVDLTPGGPVGQ
jgi:thioredoxin 1